MVLLLLAFALLLALLVLFVVLEAATACGGDGMGGEANCDGEAIMDIALRELGVVVAVVINGFVESCGEAGWELPGELLDRELLGEGPFAQCDLLRWVLLGSLDMLESSCQPRTLSKS